MLNNMIPKYLENDIWPIIADITGLERSASDHYGDIECPFCDRVICPEGKVLEVGDVCHCKAKVIRFKRL